jgi:hypothetical protein
LKRETLEQHLLPRNERSRAKHAEVRQGDLLGGLVIRDWAAFAVLGALGARSSSEDD